MRLGSRSAFLVLHSAGEGKQSTTEIVPALSSIVSTWTPGTRISPLLGVKEYNTHTPSHCSFKGDNLLLFFGPVSPARLRSELKEAHEPSLLGMWAGVGCLNVIVNIANNTDGRRVTKVIREWLSEYSISYECWTIRDGLILEASGETQSSIELSEALKTPAMLASLEDVDPLLRTPLQEYCALMASALARSAAVMPTVHSDLLQVNKTMYDMVQLHRAGDMPPLDAQASLIGMNAALSRFASQAFSGIPPIRQTECHFWVHSLLGTGVANLALSKVSTYVQTALGQARIPEKVESFIQKSHRAPTLDQLTSDPAFPYVDHLANAPLNGPGNDFVMPLVTYFSGRDGFSSHLNTLSAPLTTIAECNSYRSSLLTVTHEVSHILVQGVLGYIHPDGDNDKDARAAAAMVQPHYQADNWLYAIQQLLLEGLLGMEQAAIGQDIDAKNLTPELMASILRSWRRESQEILVHTFDFLYFYAADPTAYIKSIWHSWCAIPGIGERVPEYILRTLCAISPDLLRESPDKRGPAARRQVEEALQQLIDENHFTNSYANQGLTYLQSNWEHPELRKSIHNAYKARLPLVRLVKTFLHSEAVAADLFSDPYAAGASSARHPKQKGILDLEPIGNPLGFVTEHLAVSPSEADSLWVLYNLAFNLREERGA